MQSKPSKYANDLINSMGCVVLSVGLMVRGGCSWERENQYSAISGLPGLFFILYVQVLITESIAPLIKWKVPKGVDR